jgi:hypothetical protein
MVASLARKCCPTTVRLLLGSFSVDFNDASSADAAASAGSLNLLGKPASIEKVQQRLTHA